MNSESSFTELVEVMARLRAPNGCPWDREQTHATLKPYFIEETYEALEAIDVGDDDEFCKALAELKRNNAMSDNDALEDTIKISEYFINNGIDVRMMKFKEKDPSEIGFKSLLYLINKTTKTKFSDLMRLKLNGKTKKYMEVL